MRTRRKLLDHNDYGPFVQKGKWRMYKVRLTELLADMPWRSNFGHYLRLWLHRVVVQRKVARIAYERNGFLSDQMRESLLQRGNRQRSHVAPLCAITVRPTDQRVIL